MKNLKLLSGIMIFIIIFLMGCGGGSSSKNNEYLGELPSIEKKYANQIDKKSKEIEECTDMKDAFKLDKEKKLLKEEKKKAIEEYVASHPLIKDLPFQALPNNKYTINKVVVNKATSGNLNIKFLITINEEIKGKYGSTNKNLFIYFKAVDSEGNYIPNSTTVATNFKSVLLTAGTEYEAFGSWQNKATRNMEDFAKIVEITREEYDKNKRK
ncbi:MAG: hypothetical protein J7K39_11115 [Bacteroidales bacterium]|nr:hypothetical protein [Bacteroidales bacterium]